MGVHRPNNFTRRDFLKVVGTGASALTLAACGLTPTQKFETSSWQTASPEEKRPMAEELVKAWVSEASNSRDEFRLDSLELTEEKLFTDFDIRAITGLASAGISDPTHFVTGVYINQPNPLYLIGPDYMITETKGLSRQNPGKADLVTLRKDTYQSGRFTAEKPDWFGGQVDLIAFADLVEATTKLADPNDNYSPTGKYYPTEKTDFWSGEKSMTQWHYWLQELEQKRKAIQVPEMSVNQNALSVHAELSALFPGVQLPQVQLVQPETWQQIMQHSNKAGFQMSFLTENYDPYVEEYRKLEEFFEVLITAKDAMGKSFAKDYLTTEAVRRVLKDPPWSWDKPIEGLPPDDHGNNRLYTQGLLVTINSGIWREKFFYIYTPIRLQG